MSRLVVFENPGEIDLLTIKTFGVSVKENDNPIGFFGTGLKYALAILLRTGHGVSLQCGASSYAFGLAEHTIRGEKFNLVTLDGEPLGFTDQVGKTWEVWMAYRELYCNCKDENGRVFIASHAPDARAGLTRIIVTGDAFATEHDRRSRFILEGKPFLALDGVDIHHGESSGLFYRGMLVSQIREGQRSRYTYNVKGFVALTEDRTAKYSFMLPGMVASAIIGSEDRNLIERLIALPNDYWEHHFDYKNTAVTPSRAFMLAVECVSEKRLTKLNLSARTVYRDEKKETLEPTKTVLRGVEEDMLVRASKFVMSLGFDVSKYPIIVTDALGGDTLGIASEGTIYLSRRAFMVGTKCVAGTLIEEFVHLAHGYDDESRSMQNFLLDRLVSLGEELQGVPL